MLSGQAVNRHEDRHRERDGRRGKDKKTMRLKSIGGLSSSRVGARRSLGWLARQFRGLVALWRVPARFKWYCHSVVSAVSHLLLHAWATTHPGGHCPRAERVLPTALFRGYSPLSRPLPWAQSAAQARPRWAQKDTLRTAHYVKR